jgi:hypothetical protein
MLIITCESTWCLSPEDHSLNFHRRENFESHNNLIS